MEREAFDVRPLGPDERAVLHDLRGRVLRPGRPPDESRFPGDDAPTTMHLGAFLADRCVAVASLYDEQGMRLRGVAVEPALQGRGAGAALVRRAQEAAAAAGRGLWCNARASAAGFYEKLGWARDGEPFDLPHIGAHHVMRYPPPPREAGPASDGAAVDAQPLAGDE